MPDHALILRKSYPTGACEFYCPACGHHIVMQFPPRYKLIVLNEGDPQAAHAGGTEGLTLGARLGDDPYLDVWREWMEGKE